MEIPIHKKIPFLYWDRPQTAATTILLINVKANSPDEQQLSVVDYRFFTWLNICICDICAPWEQYPMPHLRLKHLNMHL